MIDLKMVPEVEANLASHEKICAERYAAIQSSFEASDKRITKIEYLLYAVMVAVLFGPGVAAEFLKKLIGV